MQYLSYNSNPLQLKIKYNNTIIDEVKTFKFLGIIIDQNLNWKRHIDDVCKKINRFVFALKRLRQTVSEEAALTAYHGFVKSVLSYGLLIWGNSVEINRAFILQKRCVRAICNSWYLDSCKPLFKKLKILPLPCLYIRDLCLFVKLHPTYFQKLSETSSRQVRSMYINKLHKPPGHTYMYKNNVYNMCIVIYNKLPDEMKSLDNNKFKKTLTNWLLDKCFYSVRDFFDN